MTTSRKRSLPALAVCSLLTVATTAAQDVSKPPAPKVDVPQSVLRNPSHDMTTTDVAGLTPATSACGISTDDGYGMTPEKAVQTGGPFIYFASRETKYMAALRGPHGEGLHSFRTGSLTRADGTIVDSYSVSYPGLDKPATIFIDGYHWDQPLAPKGWLCGLDMNLAPPIPDPNVTWRNIRAMAIEMGEKDVDPIPLDADGSRTHGVFFDYIRLVAAAARRASADGHPISADAFPRDLQALRVLVVAFPMDCQGKSIAPQFVAVRGRNGQEPPAETSVTEDQIKAMAPGFAVPAGAVGVTYGVPELLGEPLAVIQYKEACGTSRPQVVLPFKDSPAQVIAAGDIAAPAGVTLAPGSDEVGIQVLPGMDGSARFPVYFSGNWSMRDAAIAAAPQWKIRPATINGAYVLDTFTVPIRIR